MPATRTINVTAFKAQCLTILDGLAAHRIERVVVTRRGKPVAVLTPPETLAEAMGDLHGFMRGSVIGPRGFDLTLPVSDDAFTADSGLLHG